MKRLCAFIIITVGVFCWNCIADDGGTVNTVVYGTNNYPTIAVDVNNTPIIVCENYPQNLKLIKQTPTGYDVNVIPQTEGASYPKLRITSNNELALLFLSGSSTLKYGSKGDWFDWIFSQVQTGVSLRNPADMALTSNDVPHIACLYNNYIRHIFFDVHSQQWASENFGATYSPNYSSIAADSSGKILICYEDRRGINCILISNDNLIFLPTIQVGYATDCDFTADGVPAVAYVKSNKLYYAVYDEAMGWMEAQVVQLVSSPVQPVVLAHSSIGIPGIAYIDNPKLMYATNIAGGWMTMTIDTVCKHPELIFDKNDKPLIVYEGTDNRFGWNLPVVKLAGIGLTNMNNSFDVSGIVTDHITGLPVVNARVIWRSQTFSKYATAFTDANGFYQLADMPPGVIDVYVSADSYMSASALNLTFAADINNLDFALMPYATLSGKVLDNTTGQPIPNVKIEYSNDERSAHSNTFSDANGNFQLSNLYSGIAEIKAEPDVNSGYAWNLPWGADLVNLKEGEQRTDRIIFLEKGVLVKGFVKDANGNPFADLELYADGLNCESWIYTDANGFYQIRLPKGEFSIQPDDEEIYGMLPIAFTITDINTDVNLPDGFVYTSATGKHISGEVNNPGDYLKNGTYEIQAFKAGTNISDANSYYIDSSAAYVGILNEGAFSINNLPPDVNYDIYLMAYTAFPDDRDSQTIRDVVFDVSPDTNNVYLEYNSAGSTVSGRIKNINDATVLGAAALLFNSLGDFKGFCETDCNGLYTVYNVPDGNYTITAIHSKYADASTVIDVNDADVNAPEIVIPFAGGKEGPDLNGNGVIDLFDIAEFSGHWLDAGVNEANFNNDEFVNFYDWMPLANNWLWKAVWLNE